MGRRAKFQTQEEIDAHVVELKLELKTAPTTKRRNIVAREIIYWTNRETETNRRKQHYIKEKIQKNPNYIQDQFQKILQVNPNFKLVDTTVEI